MWAWDVDADFALVAARLAAHHHHAVGQGDGLQHVVGDEDEGEARALPQRQPVLLQLLPRAGRSEEHPSELQSLLRISYAVFCLKKNNRYTNNQHHTMQTTYIQS